MTPCYEKDVSAVVGPETGGHTVIMQATPTILRPDELISISLRLQELM